MSMSKSISASQSNKLSKRGDKIQCPKCLSFYTTSKAKTHIPSCRVVLTAAERMKMSQYSPIKEADEENRYVGEESKESSSMQKKSNPGDDYTESYPSNQFSGDKKPSSSKKKALESSGGAEESSSMSQDMTSHKQIQ